MVIKGLSRPAPFAAATAGVRGELCACGCRRRLDPDGPSPFFASQACQKRWSAAQATRPDEVFNRGDAAVPTPDGHPAPLTEPHTLAPAPAPGGPGRPGPYRFVCPDLAGAAYRRRCPQCGRNVIPVSVPTHRTRSGDPCEPPILAFHEECPDCVVLLPRPWFAAHIAETLPGRLTFTLDDGVRAVHRTVSYGGPRDQSGWGLYTQVVWLDMVAALSRGRWRPW